MIRQRFQSLDEVRAYVSGGSIQCLVCGKFFRRLGKHLQTHNMTADDYRETFGIPWNTSLTSAPSREATGSKMTPERIEVFKQVPKVRPKGRRLTCPAVRRQWAHDAALGRYHACELVTTGCAKCGAPLQTTALTAAQPIHCDDCASPAALKARASYNRTHKEAA